MLYFNKYSPNIYSFRIFLLFSLFLNNFPVLLKYSMLDYFLKFPFDRLDLLSALFDTCNSLFHILIIV